MKDNFSTQAGSYVRYRPNYPAELFEFILEHVNGRDAAWDSGTGNGQTAVELARSFATVSATDISQKQLDQAETRENIIYSLQPAERTSFLDNTFDLITVSQALHWFRFDAFYSEVRRVGKNNSWLAAWMYDLLQIGTGIDQVIRNFYSETLHGYWDSERKHVDQKYATIPFPFEEINCPDFHIGVEWSLDDLEGYLKTWSAVQQFINLNGYDPVPAVIEELKNKWQQEKMKVVFPVSLRMGRILK